MYTIFYALISFVTAFRIPINSAIGANTTNQTISQRDAQLVQWAQLNNCTDQYNAFVAREQSATKNLQSKVVTTLVEMQLAFQNLFALQTNTSATTNEIVSTIEQTLSVMSPDKRTLLNQLLRIANGDPLSPGIINPGNNGNNGGVIDPINTGGQSGGQSGGGNPIQPPVWQPNGNFGVNVLHVS
ncbi:unnamed protein product, partial [Mesorhabditis belari]|uniref:SXP/RAL-2 family protein Ani s 5-like cation-binding domain-containing protein n=1 Tax=Mesorhabditis belari TaxID=2138241 RepID=A0AAF3F402_9BILA